MSSFPTIPLSTTTLSKTFIFDGWLAVVLKYKYILTGLGNSYTMTLEDNRQLFALMVTVELVTEAPCRTELLRNLPVFIQGQMSKRCRDLWGFYFYFIQWSS